MRNRCLMLCFLALTLTILACKKEQIDPDPGPPALKITVNDQDFSVDENSTANTSVGTVSFSFNGTNSNLSFSFDNAPADFPFEIDKTTGAIKVKTDESLNHELKSSYVQKIIIAHDTDASLNKTFTATINLNDVDERPSNNLKAYYPLDESTDDASGNDVNGTMDGDLESVKDRFENPASAYNFDAGEQIKVDNYDHFNGMEKFTIGLWVNIPALDGGTAIKNFLYKFSPSRDFALGYDGTGRINFHFYKSGYLHLYSDAGDLPAEKWTHVIASFENSTMKIYINGVKVNERNTDGRSPDWVAENFGLGGLVGTMDEIRIYDATFSDEEIAVWYEEESVND